MNTEIKKLKSYKKVLLNGIELEGEFFDSNKYYTKEEIDPIITKLNTIENNAQVNVQADWSEQDKSSDAFIKNKPALGTYTLDFFEDSYMIQDINMYGSIIINEIKPFNIGKIFVSYDKIIKKEISLDQEEEFSIEIPANARIIWEIEREKESQPAALGIGFNFN